MSPLKLVFLFLCLRTIVSKKIRYNPRNLDEATSKDNFNCLDQVGCIEKLPLELRKIADAAEGSPELMKDIYEYISAVGVLAHYDDESYYRMADRLCKMSFAEKENNCEIPDNESEYCIAYDNMCAAGHAFIDKYTKLGVCNNPERMAQQAKDAIGGGIFG